MSWNKNLAAPSAADTDAPVQGLETSRLDRVLRIIDAGPRPFYRAAIVSLAVTSLLAVTISSFIRPSGRLPDPQREMIFASLAALCLSAVLGMASLAHRGRSWQAVPLDRVVGPEERSAIWLALATWIPCLLFVVYFRAEATLPSNVRWLYFGFEDKRWEDATYLLGALAPMIWLAAAARVLAVGRGQPRTWGAWLAGLFTRDGATGIEVAASANAAGAAGHLTRWRRSWAGRIVPTAAGLATALVLAWYFLGPPWYLTRTISAVAPQEDIWLTGFEAIARGHLPYIGVGGVPYGPGTQVASYLIMRHFTSFSVVGFRQAWALYQWVGASILFAVFFLAFGYVRGLAISLLSLLVYPALRQVAFQPFGSFTGYFGWANPLRYVGLIAVVALAPAVIRRCPSKRGTAAGAVLGVLWGLTSYMGQENLIAGAVGVILTGAVLLFSRTFSWHAVRAALASVLAGFLLIWLPVLAFYAIHGDLGQFLRLYFLIPRAMAQGFGNYPWQGGTHMPFSLTTMFYALPFLLAVGALLTAFEVHPIRIATGWSPERVRLAVTVIITILLYQGALLRSDLTDMTGTLLMVPALVIVIATVLPRLFVSRGRVTAAVVGAALAATSFMLLPTYAFAWGSVRVAAEAPYLDRYRPATDALPSQPTTLAASRIGAGLDSAPQCCQGPPANMASLVHLMNRFHAIIGDRVTYVTDFPHGYPGFVYFVADLTPAPVLDDKYMTILNEPQLIAYMAYFRVSVLPHTQALVTSSLRTTEARLFLLRYRGARRILLHFGRKPFYILLAQS